MPGCPHSPVECFSCRRARRQAEAAAAQPTPAEVAAAAARAREAQEARRAQAEREAAIILARRLYRAAQKWPRCGQCWPMNAAERAADKLLQEEGYE